MTWRDYGNDCREEGREEGRVEGRMEVIENILRKGKTPQEIVDFCGFELDIVEQVQESLLARTK